MTQLYSCIDMVDPASQPASQPASAQPASGHPAGQVPPPPKYMCTCTDSVLILGYCSCDAPRLVLSISDARTSNQLQMDIPPAHCFTADRYTSRTSRIN